MKEESTLEKILKGFIAALILSILIVLIVRYILYSLFIGG